MQFHLNGFRAGNPEVSEPSEISAASLNWWPVHDTGQRLCDKFDDVPEEQIAIRAPHVFIADDACHTHTKKLIDFDREWAKLTSSPLKPPSDADGDGADRDEGRLIVARPDRYILPPDAYEDFSAFFDAFMLPKNYSKKCNLRS